MTIGQKIVHKYKAEYRQAPPTLLPCFKIIMHGFCGGAKTKASLFARSCHRPKRGVKQNHELQEGISKKQKTSRFFLGRKMPNNTMFL